MIPRYKELDWSDQGLKTKWNNQVLSLLSENSKIWLRNVWWIHKGWSSKHCSSKLTFLHLKRQLMN